MKKTYSSPEVTFIVMETMPLCGVSGGQASMDSTHTVDASSSLSRDGGDWGDED